jgi:hypothetical protein
LTPAGGAHSGLVVVFREEENLTLLDNLTGISATCHSRRGLKVQVGLWSALRRPPSAPLGPMVISQSPNQVAALTHADADPAHVFPFPIAAVADFVRQHGRRVSTGWPP